MTATIDPGFATAASVAALSPAAHVTAMLRVEAAVARGLGAAGLADAAVADRVVGACRDPIDDPDAVLAEGWDIGTPVLALLERVRGRLTNDEPALELLHRGLTTQDVVDTATVLQLRDVLSALDDDLVDLVRATRDQVATHRATPVRGRTLLQPADPTTVGRRMATWLAPLVEHTTALRTLERGLPLQLGGPTGTLAAYGDAADRVTATVARDLGLVVPPMPWHTDRGPLVAVVSRLARLAGSISTIATDVVLLAACDGVRVRAGASSSMPDKRNPVDAVHARAAAIACIAAAGGMLGGQPHELERAAGAWQAERWVLPQVLHTAAAATAALARTLGSLEVTSSEPEEATVAPGATAAVDRAVAAADDLLDGGRS